MSATLTRHDAASFRTLVARTRRFVEPELDPEQSERLHRLFGRPLSADEAVREIVDDVRRRGDTALREWTARIDGVDVAELHAAPAAMAAAWEATPPELRDALTVARDRIREFHALQRDTTVRGTAELGLRPVPLRRAGCYVPGGRAAYPSTVLMNVIPAQVAGVDSVVVATPPTPDGRAHPAVLAAAHLLGVDEVAVMGGAQAIAALAYGTESLRAVDTIVGPGNLFVTLAKRAVFGSVGIDGLAGPSEIIVVASDGADPRLVAADLVSQLEHDPLAWAVCVTDSADIATRVEAAFVPAAESAVRNGIIAAAAGRHGLTVVCADLEEALELVDDFAPEHLELQGAGAEALADRVRTAGAIFVGDDSPVPMGDYIAGPNHTLPTGGAARFKGPLSVMDFVRWSSVTRLRRDEMVRLGPVACTLAEAEGLHGHTASIRLRLGGVPRMSAVAPRTAAHERVTKETQISVEVNLDGAGVADVELPLPFFRHMLQAYVKYSGMDVRLHGAGDIEVDSHHLVEDCGLVLGATVSRALGDRAGIRRFGSAHAPLDESLVRCVLDFSNRPYLVWELAPLRGRINDFDVEVLHEFVRGYAQTAGISMHVDYVRGENLHHIAEAAFKAMGLATREALERIGGSIPSTKGVL